MNGLLEWQFRIVSNRTWNHDCDNVKEARDRLASALEHGEFNETGVVFDDTVPYNDTIGEEDAKLLVASWKETIGKIIEDIQTAIKYGCVMATGIGKDIQKLPQEEVKVAEQTNPTEEDTQKKSDKGEGTAQSEESDSPEGGTDEKEDLNETKSALADEENDPSKGILCYIS
ncbi:unnamed protein product [Cylicocyclus nassatus]|uniref:Uncharacterized protein n=1 Tax=Cylicocyclus nassatus TaxID=53992 RepID=A0AA36DP99_CYLNA|nr:unnamed protein product [Cylicocyclus nassatus]